MHSSLVIATKDRAAYLERAIGSLERQIAAPYFDVVVVDNASHDTTHAVVEAAQRRGVLPIYYVYEAEPNRGKARNRGVAAAEGTTIVFCDDDVQLPAGFVAAHVAAHDAPRRVVCAPILNVAGYAVRPKPTLANYSRAFVCTCNVSMPKALFTEVGGFDESFSLYGWEDTELGVRLRAAGASWRFAWDAYLWHIKPPNENTLEVEARKAVERARMARRFVEKHPSARARMATGAYAANLLRARMFPERLLALYAGVASSERAPGWLRGLARAQFLDGTYTRELRRALSQ